MSGDRAGRPSTADIGVITLVFAPATDDQIEPEELAFVIEVVLDEVDGLLGESIVSLLTQLRQGYISREELPFPASVVLVGQRQVRDYALARRAVGHRQPHLPTRAWGQPPWANSTQLHISPRCLMFFASMDGPAVRTQLCAADGPFAPCEAP